MTRTIAALVAAIIAGAASAQEADVRRPLDEIVVTAQKRTELLQEIPAAVTAIDRETFTVRGITTLADVQNLVPSVRLQKESASTEIYIRGVGSTLDLPMIEPPNAYNINGVYVPREVTSASLVDIERMEFLPGPQGTLYGRGAIGGVVNTITRRPGDEFETNSTVEAGNYSHIRATVSQNIPISDNTSMRASLSYFERDGYLKKRRRLGGRPGGLHCAGNFPRRCGEYPPVGSHREPRGLFGQPAEQGQPDEPQKPGVFPTRTPGTTGSRARWRSMQRSGLSTRSTATGTRPCWAPSSTGISTTRCR